jgi:hypothetical protein
MARDNLDTPESLLAEALKHEEQAKFERDPKVVRFCLLNRDFFLDEAAKLERASNANG